MTGELSRAGTRWIDIESTIFKALFTTAILTTQVTGKHTNGIKKRKKKKSQLLS